MGNAVGRNGKVFATCTVSPVETHYVGDDAVHYPSQYVVDGAVHYVARHVQDVARYCVKRCEVGTSGGSWSQNSSQRHHGT